MRSVYAFQAPCCDPDLEYICVLCGRVSCLDHDQSPGEHCHICSYCWNPIDFEEESC